MVIKPSRVCTFVFQMKAVVSTDGTACRPVAGMWFLRGSCVILEQDPNAVNSPVFLFCQFGLEMPIRAIKMRFSGDLTP